MSCGVGCSGGPTRFSPEYTRQWKAQNNAGCACSGTDRNNCDKPSLAKVGSPLWEWEQIYGKLTTRIIHTQDDQGHSLVTIEKIPCPVRISTKSSRHGCCSASYRVNR